MAGSSNSSSTIPSELATKSQIAKHYRMMGIFDIEGVYYFELKNPKNGKIGKKADEAINIIIRYSNHTNKKDIIPHDYRKKFKAEYNGKLDKFLTLFNDDSIFRNLLYINKDLKLISHTGPKNRSRIDWNYKIPLRKIGEDEDDARYILRFSQNGDPDGVRCNFDSADECLNAVTAYLKDCTWSDIMPDSNIESIKHYTVNIKFPGGPGLKPKIINSHSTRLRHILCEGHTPHLLHNGRLPFKLVERFPFYNRFFEELDKKVILIIKQSENNPLCPIRIIDCCRTVPIICNKTNVALKNSRRFQNKNSLSCGSCRLELCAKGCGKVYHGEFSCDMSIDEASQIFINQTSLSCPGCKGHVDKNGGCNHMICLCGTQFCFVCGLEYHKNALGNYMVMEHHTDNNFGLQQGGTCRQYG